MKFDNIPKILLKNASEIAKEKKVKDREEKQRKELEDYIAILAGPEFKVVMAGNPLATGYRLFITHKETKMYYGLDSISHLTPGNIEKEIKMLTDGLLIRAKKAQQGVNYEKSNGVTHNTM